MIPSSDLIFLKENVHGVFLKIDVPKNFILELCPIIFFPKIQNFANTSIASYTYDFDNENYLMALGYGSLYRHLPIPNADYMLSPFYTLDIFTLVELKAGDEIFINRNKILSDKQV